MPTTTNYGWTTPADTDLVKDGASAIRTLGTAIDTTVFNNAGAAIAKTIVDAKGDIIAATAADTVSRLAVGSNDQVLTADSSTATGLKWATPASGGGMTLLSTTTLTGASVTLSSIPQTYNNLQLIIRDFLPSQDGGQLRMRFNADSTADLHYYDVWYNSTGSAAWNRNFLVLLNDLDNSVANGLIWVDIYDYANTATHKMGLSQGFGANTTTTSNIQYYNNRLFYKSTNAISSLQFYSDNGDLGSGTVLLYGVK